MLLIKELNQLIYCVNNTPTNDEFTNEAKVNLLEKLNRDLQDLMHRANEAKAYHSEKLKCGAIMEYFA